jgi:hypothetical protein
MHIIAYNQISDTAILFFNPPFLWVALLCPSHLLGCQERPVLFNANAAFSRVFDGIPNIAFLKIMLI